MNDKEHIKEFSQMLDRLVSGENMPTPEGFDPGMMDIARTLADAELADLSRDREALRRRLGQQRASMRAARTGGIFKPGISVVAAFSMGFVTVAVLVLIGLAIILPLVRQSLSGDIIARESEATPTAFLALDQHSPSPAVIVPTLPWTPPEHVDHIVAVMGNVGAVQQLTASLPSEDGLVSHVIQTTIDISPEEGNAGRRSVEFSVDCSGTGTEKLHWGWWGQPPAMLTCGSTTSSDDLSWSHNTVYFVIEVPPDGITAVTYTFTVKVGDYNE